jgi:hypothetical protein
MRQAQDKVEREGQCGSALPQCNLALHHMSSPCHSCCKAFWAMRADPAAACFARRGPNQGPARHSALVCHRCGSNLTASIYMPGSKYICLAASAYAWQQVHMPGSKYICLAASIYAWQQVCLAATTQLSCLCKQHNTRSRAGHTWTLLYSISFLCNILQQDCAAVQQQTDVPSKVTHRSAFKSDSNHWL